MTLHSCFPASKPLGWTFHRETKHFYLAILRAASGPRLQGAAVSVWKPAIEAAMGAARSIWRLSMATIGTFTKSGDRYQGAVRTLTLNVEAQIAPAEKENDKAPDYRVFAGQIEFGAAWKKTSSAGQDYLSVKLDDPSLPAPIYASLVEAEGENEFTLIWSRQQAK
jgi:uncharacterized protein (DUF736 family)